ncbi:hypothetical protein U0070_002409, partial [Myodes glareolus]
DHSVIKRSDPTTLQNQENQENEDLRATTQVPSLPDQSQEDGRVTSSGRNGANDNKNSKRPLEKRSLCTDGFSKLGNNKKTAATTPNFKKLHEARFKKMESIDEYIQFSQDQFLGPESQDTMCLIGSGKHSVLSATKMNVSSRSMIAFRFSAATKDNEHKYSLTKTPARKSPRVTLPGSASKGQAVFRTPKLKTTERNSTTAGSSKKPVFDLQASLSRPLNYKPHKGKLKPWGQSKENSSLKEGVSRVSFHRRTYKQPHLHTREEQRKKHEQERKERKAKVLDARRNLV